MASTLHKCETAGFYHHGRVLSWFAHAVWWRRQTLPSWHGSCIPHWVTGSNLFPLNALLYESSVIFFSHLRVAFFIWWKLAGKRMNLAGK
jgi:hypothetical protein